MVPSVRIAIASGDVSESCIYRSSLSMSASRNASSASILEITFPICDVTPSSGCLISKGISARLSDARIIQPMISPKRRIGINANEENRVSYWCRSVRLTYTGLPGARSISFWFLKKSSKNLYNAARYGPCSRKGVSFPLMRL